MKKIYTLLVIFLLAFTNFSIGQTTAIDLVFNIEVVNGNNFVQLKWNKQINVPGYNVLRKDRNSKTFIPLVTDLNINDTSFIDNTIQNGTAYEYCVQSSTNLNISGYVYAGSELPAIHQSGEILLLIDNTYQTSAYLELEQYKLDLIKEGWKVSIEYVSRTQSVISVKQLILDEYALNPNGLKGVILLGHVPVPYSGKIAPDAHADHQGAWPSDVYYADVSPLSGNSWSDQTINSTTATDPRNRNIVGDSKFDISVKSTTSDIKLFVGRVDVYNMSTISSDDAMLFKQYLTKNHAYRSSQKHFRQMGLVQDSFGFMSGEAFAQNGWRNFSNILGGDKVEAGNLVSGLKTNSYIWSYACGPGWYQGAQYVGTTTDFKSNQMESVFTMMYGSYFGDWDNANNFLRAPIASPSSTLVSIWGGRPNWFLHTMSLGEPIGYSYINSVDNITTYYPKGLYAGQVHQSMQGDPTLKMYMYQGASNFTAYSIDNNTKVSLNWNASLDSNVIGYYIYKANSLDDDFQLITTNYLTTNSYIVDLNGSAYDPTAVYMVKAVKLEQTNTGSFYNLSPGTFNYTPSYSPLPVTIASFSGQKNNNKTNTLFWEVKNEKELAFYELERSNDLDNYESIAQIEVKKNGQLENSYSYIDQKPLIQNYYRLKGVDIDGKVTYSDVVSIANQESIGELVAFPSPFDNSINIRCNSDVEGIISCTLTDMYGKIIRTQSIEIKPGINMISFNGLDGLVSGMYFVTVYEAETNTRNIIKILKR